MIYSCIQIPVIHDLHIYDCIYIYMRIYVCVFVLAKVFVCFSGLVRTEAPSGISVPRITCHPLLGGLCRWPGILVKTFGGCRPDRRRSDGGI